MAAPIAESIAAGDALHAFAAGWRARFPEWTLAERFLAEQRRRGVLARCVLWQELADAAWSGDDPRPGQAKLAWWQQELATWDSGHGRHPLAATVLDGTPDAAPRWSALAVALPAWPALRERPRDGAERDALLLPAASAFAVIESARLTQAPLRRPAPPGSAGSDACIGHALRRLQRLHALARGSAAMPLAEGRADDPVALRRWQHALAARPANTVAADAGAALQGALLARRLRAAGRSADLRWPFTCWRAARSGRD